MGLVMELLKKLMRREGNEQTNSKHAHKYLGTSKRDAKRDLIV